MTGWGRRGLAGLRRFVVELGRRCRDRGRTALFRALRIAGATVAAFVVAQAVGLSDPPPLVAALTALLVVQATLRAISMRSSALSRTSASRYSQPRKAFWPTVKSNAWGSRS